MLTSCSNKYQWNYVFDILEPRNSVIHQWPVSSVDFFSLYSFLSRLSEMDKVETCNNTKFIDLDCLSPTGMHSNLANVYKTRISPF